MTFNLTNLFGINELLSNSGDEVRARVTRSGRKVGIIRTGDGMNKYSITKYPNGTIVETKTTRRKSR